jgi:hypothetical protein
MPSGQHNAELVLGLRQTSLAYTYVLFLTSQHNLVWALMIAIPLVTSLYVLVNIQLPVGAVTQ